MHEQQKELTYKDKFNIIHALCVIHQRSIVIVCRNKFGKNALGMPCGFAMLLMFLWAAFSQDTLMYCWLGFWCLCYAKRRIEAGRLYGQVHTYYDGWPFDAVRLCGSESVAKRFIEPVLVGILGFGSRWFYLQQGWSPGGLPNFLIIGVVTLPFVEWVKQKAHERRLDGVRDARLEQESLAQNYRDRFGP